MNQLETGEASEATHGNSDLQKELAEVLRQRAALSAALRAIANSPHDLQPIAARSTVPTSEQRLNVNCSQWVYTPSVIYTWVLSPKATRSSRSLQFPHVHDEHSLRC